MNTITAFSDSHNMPLPSRLIDVTNESKYVFFLGDGLSSLGDLLCHKGFYGVKAIATHIRSTTSKSSK